MGTHWYVLVNKIEPSMCGGDATLCQITLTTGLATGQLMDTPIRRLPTRRLVNSWTGQVGDSTARGLVKLRSSQLMDWSICGCCHQQCS